MPFVRFGGWLLASRPNRVTNAGALLHASPINVLFGLGGLAGHAMLAWLVLAVPAVALMTFALTVLLRRLPALAAAETAN